MHLAQGHILCILHPIIYVTDCHLICITYKVVPIANNLPNKMIFVYHNRGNTLYSYVDTNTGINLAANIHTIIHTKAKISLKLL